MMITRVLILGSNAFTASHFINYLLEQTDAKVVGISRSPEYDPVFLPYLYKKARSRRYHFHRFDVNQDMDEIMAVCDRFRPQAVVNFAAQGEVRNSWMFPEQWYRTNCLGVVRLTERLRTRDYLEKYIAVSTPEVYGITGEKIPETHHYYPSTPYAASKLAGDLHLFALFKHYGFPVVFTRAANLYGIHQQLYRIIPRTIIYFKLGRIIQLHGRGNTLRGFIHARDVAEFTYRALTHGRKGEIYHVAPDEGLRSIADVVRFICEMKGCDFDGSVHMIEENFGQDARFGLDATKAKKELGWNQQVSFEEGVAETDRWIEDNWQLIRTQPLDYVHRE